MSSIANIYLEDDEALIKRKLPKQFKPNFYMIGNGTMNKHKIKAIDLLDEITTLSKAGQFVILTIKNGVTYSNQDGEVYVPMAEFTATQQTVWKKGFKECKERNLVKRTKQSHYLVNPNALIPPDYDAAMEKWNEV